MNKKLEELSEEEQIQAALCARIAARAEAKALARMKKKKTMSNSKSASSTPLVPRFSSKAARQKAAMERAEAKRKKIQEEQAAKRKQRLAFVRGNANGGSASSTSNDTRETRSLPASSSSFVSNSNQRKKKNRQKRPTKFRRIFRFEHSLEDDTSVESDPLYAERLNPQLAFGRGYLAGIDIVEQRKKSTYMTSLLDKRDEDDKKNSSNGNSISMNRKNEREKIIRAEEKVNKRIMDKLSRTMNSTRHWTTIKSVDNMTSRDWRIMREDFDIRVRGGRAPNPIRFWNESKIHASLLKAMSDMGFVNPSPIQRQAIPIGMNWRDIIGIAETGSGKTAAFSIPMIQYIEQCSKTMRENTPTDGPLALIMAPTRELAQQIEAEVQRLVKYINVKSACIVGGVSIEDQGFILRNGVDIVIGTPGRIIDCLDNHYMVLNQCYYVVLDEADRMIDMGFETQIQRVMKGMGTSLKSKSEEEIERQISKLQNSKNSSEEKKKAMVRVTSMYSATMPPELSKLAETYMRSPVVVSIGDQKSRLNKRITQNIIMIAETAKLKNLTQCLSALPRSTSCIVFCNTKKVCDYIHQELRKRTFRTVVLHSGKSQDMRKASLEDFRSGKYQILIATDVAGRGIDVPNVKQVFNYDMPSDIQRYTHRIGRTGRAGKTGISTTFLTENDSEVYWALHEHLKATEQSVPRELERHPMTQRRPGEHTPLDDIRCPLLVVLEKPASVVPSCGQRRIDLRMSDVKTRHPGLRTKDSFKIKKVPKVIDDIVIGSGIGGMYTAACLAKTGRCVLVLEQHYVIGGCCHEFTDHGYTFDTGIHYVGKPEKYGYLLDLVTKNEEDKVKWCRLGTEENGYVYDVMAIGDCEPVGLPAGKQAYIDCLAKIFPEERNSIEEFVRLCLEVNKRADMFFFGKLFPSWLQRVTNYFFTGKFTSLSNRTLQDVLDSITDNKKLQAHLAYCFGDHGATPAKASFFMHAGIVCHYLEKGGYYPRGGTGRIAEALVPTIEASGGRCLVKAQVQKIIVDKRGRARGVKMADGTMIFARKSVICAGGVEVMQKLLEEDDGDRNLANRAKISLANEKLGQSVSHITTFIGIRGSQAELKLPSSNLWRLPCDTSGPNAFNLDDTVNAYHDSGYVFVDKKVGSGGGDQSSKSSDIFFFAGFPSAKDPTYNDEGRHPGKSVACVITEAKHAHFMQWEDPKDPLRGGQVEGKRKDPEGEYRRCKERFQKKLVECLERHFPVIKGKIDFVETGTPLTQKYYYMRAASYGLDAGRLRWGDNEMSRNLRPQVENIKNLYIAGEDIVTAGYAGALTGGLLCAMSVLKYNFVDLVLFKRNLVHDLAYLVKRQKEASKKCS
eukprot:g5986.t1